MGLILDALFPPRCGLCGVAPLAALCPECAKELIARDPIFETTEFGTRVACAFPYSGRPGQLVRRLKYNRVTALARPMARELAEFTDRLRLPETTVFLPVPIHYWRLCERGFNQSELLCSELPRVETRWLKRTRPTKQQAGLTREGRLKNLQGAFRASEKVRGQAICLIDDVCTTGSTLAHCEEALRAAGAAQVIAICATGWPEATDPPA